MPTGFSILRIPYRMQPIIAVQFRFALQFSILRTPHGMQRGNESYSVISILRIPCVVQRFRVVSFLLMVQFQSYASLAGCNYGDWLTANHPGTFQSYASLAGCNIQIGNRLKGIVSVSILRIPCRMQQQQCTLHALLFMQHCTLLLIWLIYLFDCVFTALDSPTILYIYWCEAFSNFMCT